MKFHNPYVIEITVKKLSNDTVLHETKTYANSQELWEFPIALLGTVIGQVHKAIQKIKEDWDGR